VFIATIFTKLSQLILRKIIKIVATRCRILRLKCTKIDFGTPLGELTALSRGKGRKGDRKGRNGKGIHSGLDSVPYFFGFIFSWI